jgi:hypothetical protein
MIGGSLARHLGRHRESIDDLDCALAIARESCDRSRARPRYRRPAPLQAAAIYTDLGVPEALGASAADIAR